jgi:hypothetical protein
MEAESQDQLHVKGQGLVREVDHVFIFAFAFDEDRLSIRQVVMSQGKRLYI